MSSGSFLFLCSLVPNDYKPEPLESTSTPLYDTSLGVTSTIAKVPIFLLA